MTTTPVCTVHDAEPRSASFRTVDLPCGCQDIYYADGTVCFEHAHAECHDAGVVLVRGELRETR